MKTAMVSIGLIMALCSCAATNAADKTTVAVYQVAPNYGQEPTNDLKIDALNTRDNTTQTVAMLPETEEANYYASINRIIDKMRAENLQLTMCAEVHGDSSYCKDLRKKLCVVDELIDTRSDIHRKPYCHDPLTNRNH
jgi:hypothetical protein